MKKRIWQLIDTSNVGGIETHVIHLSRTLQIQGFDNSIVQLKDYGKHPVLDDDENRDLHLIRGQGIRDVIQRSLRERPDIIHAHGSKACLVAKFISCVSQIKVICTYHTGETGIGLQGIYDRINNLTAMIGKAIAVSDLIARKLTTNARRINNFIPLPKSIPTTNDNHTFAFVGRLSYEKGPDRFIELAQQHSKGSFSVFGRGPMLETLENNKPENVTFLTDVNNMDSYWQEIDLLCITSREEGLPLVAIEAMARGICVACYPVGGLPSLIKDQHNGFIIREQTVAAFHQFILQYVELSEITKELIRRNAQKTIADNYSAESVVPKIIRLYQESEMEWVS